MVSYKNVGQWDQLRKNLQRWRQQFLKKEVEKLKNKRTWRAEPLVVDHDHDDSHRMDDLPLTLNKESGPGIRYYDTENSEFAKAAMKTKAEGIDSFGEENTFDPEAEVDFQDSRNRNQNSDLSHRFFTYGMDMRKEDLEH